MYLSLCMSDKPAFYSLQSLNEIARIVKAAKSSISLWVRDIPQPKRFTKRHRHEQRLKRLKKLKEEREKNKKIRKERVLSGDGRWMVPTPPGYKGKSYIRGLYVYEHRLKMEEKLGRLLKSNELVHHKDENKLNNDDENLELKSRGDHTKHHHKEKEMMEMVCKECVCNYGLEVTIYKYKTKIGQKNFFCCRSHHISFQQRERWRLKKLLGSSSTGRAAVR